MSEELDALVDELGIVVANDRDRLGLAWLFAQLGVDGLRDAAVSLAGNRKPYVSNLAKAANRVIPKEATAEVSKAQAAAALGRMRAALRGQR